jgi:hypothetical protein
MILLISASCWLWTVSLLISASRVTMFTGMSHQCPVSFTLLLYWGYTVTFTKVLTI